MSHCATAVEVSNHKHNNEEKTLKVLVKNINLSLTSIFNFDFEKVFASTTGINRITGNDWIAKYFRKIVTIVETTLHHTFIRSQKFESARFDRHNQKSPTAVDINASNQALVHCCFNWVLN